MREISNKRAQFESIPDFEVEAIQQHRRKGDDYEFLTKWRGFARSWNTWEPAEHFLPVVHKVWRNYVLKHDIPVVITDKMGYA